MALVGASWCGGGLVGLFRGVEGRFTFGKDDGFLQVIESAESLASSHGVGCAGEFAVGVGEDGLVDLSGVIPVALAFGEQSETELGLADGAIVLRIAFDDFLIEVFGVVSDVVKLLVLEVGVGETEV